MPSLRNSPRIRSAPHRRFCPAISLINATASTEIFGLADAALDLYFQYSLNPWRCQRRSVSGWMSDVRLLPCSSHACQEHQKHAICSRASRSFDLSAKDNQLLAQERVFCHEFGRASGKVCCRPQHERGSGWLCPVNEAAVERLKAYACQSFDEGDDTLHCYNSFCEDEQVYAFRFYSSSAESARANVGRWSQRPH